MTARRKARGVSAPRDEVLLFRQKDPKPLAPGRGPSGAFAPVPTVRAAELASLKQSSPPTGFRDCGAASPAGARKWRDEVAGVTAGKRQIPRYARNNRGGSRMTGEGDSCGVSAPRDEVLLFRQKDPKPLAPRRGPPGAFAPVPTVRAAELASLKQSSPPTGFRDCGAATPAGARKWRDEIAGVTAGKRQIPRYARNDRGGSG